MSVKHLEYLKISDSKVLVVEVRPVKCLLDTPSGPVHTDKWMDHSHWKELKHLMLEVVEEYEEQKITQGIKHNQPKCKTGGTIQIGYMFSSLPYCWCSLYFLTPRGTWSSTDNDFSGELQDKGGRFEGLSQCGEMLVISVILQDSSPLNTIEASPSSSSGTFQQACLKHKLMKALDGRTTYSPSISDYFKSSTVSDNNSSARRVPSSSGRKQKSSPERVKILTSKSCNPEHESDEIKSEAESVTDCSDNDNSVSPSTRFYVKEVNSEALGGIALLNVFDSKVNICSKVKSPPNSAECTKDNVTVISHKKNLENDNKRPMGSAYEDGDINLDAIYSNYDSLTSERQKSSLFYKNLEHQYNTSNNNIDFFDMNTSPCSPLKSDSLLENDSVEEQIYHCLFANPTHEADENRELTSVVYNPTMFGQVNDVITGSEDYISSCKIGNPQKTLVSNLVETGKKVRTLEVHKSDECTPNANENEIQMDSVETTLPHKDCNKSLPETSTCNRKNDKNSPSLEVECPSTSCAVGTENSLNCEQMLQHVTLYVKSPDYGCEIVKEEHFDSDSDQFKSELLLDSSVLNSSGQKFSSATADSSSEVNESSGAQSGLENYGIRCLDNETGYVHHADIEFQENGPCRAEEVCIPSKVSQNFPSATAGSASEVNEGNSAQSGLENYGIKCLDKETGYVYQAGIKYQDNVPCRGEEECIPSKVSNKWKTNNKQTVSSVKPVFKHLRNFAVGNNGSYAMNDCVMPEGDLTYKTGADSVGDTDRYGIGFQNNVTCRADEEYLPKKVTCNWKKRKSKMNISNLEIENVPINERNIANYESSSGDDFEVEEGDLTQVSEGLPLCVNNEGGAIQGIQQQIQETEVSAPLAICKNESDIEIAFEEDDSFFASTVKSGSQNIPSAVEIPQKHVPPQRLTADADEKKCNTSCHPKSLQNWAQSTKLNREVLEKSTIINNQEGDNQGVKKSLTKQLQAFRMNRHCRSEGEICLKRVSSRNQKRNNRIRTRRKRRKELKQKEIASHTSSSDADTDNENLLEGSVVEGSIPSQNSRVVGNSCLKKAKSYVHELETSSHESSTCTQGKQSGKVTVGDPGGKCVSQSGKSRKLSSISKDCSQQKVALDGNREAQLSVSSKKHKMKVAETDATTQVFMSTRLMTRKMKRKCVPTNGEKNTAKKSKSPECVIQAEGLDQNQQDARVVHKFGESSQNCTPSQTDNSSRLSEKDVSDTLQSGEHHTETALRRSNRVKKRVTYSCDNSFQNDNIFGAETEKSIQFFEKYKEERSTSKSEKSIKFFEKYVKERNTSKHNLRQKKISEYIKYKHLEQENDDSDFRVTHKKKNSINLNKKISEPDKSTKIKNKTSQHLQRKDNSKLKLSKPTGEQSTCDTSKSLEQLAVKSPPKTCALTSPNGQRKKKAQRNTTYMKTKRKELPSQEREVSPTINIKKRGRKKKSEKDNTSTVSDSPQDSENHAPASEKDPLLWIMQAEKEELDPIVSDVDSLPEVTVGSDSSPSTEEESEASVKEKLQSSEREDDIDIVYFHNLTSLRASYRRLHDMTNVELEKKLDENLSYLERVIQGLVPNERHEMFVSSIQELKRQPDYLICGPFTTDQTEYLLDLLKKKLSHMDKLFGNVYDVLTYRCRVLMPTFYTKLVMDFENVSLARAEELLFRFSVDRNIIRSSDSRD